MTKPEVRFNKRIGNAFDEDSFIIENKVIVNFTKFHFGFSLPYYWVFSKLEINLNSFEYNARLSVFRLWLSVSLLILLAYLEYKSGAKLFSFFIGLGVVLEGWTYFRLHSKVKDEILSYKKTLRYNLKV